MRTVSERTIQMRINKNEAADMLLEMDNILILAHENPDGDAVGSACALCKGLRSIGKRAYISLEPISKTDAFMTEKLVRPAEFIPEHIVAVDTADIKILGVEGSGLDKSCEVELCIDHHMSNVFFARNTYLDESASAAAEAVYDIMKTMNIPFTKDIAECLYVGIATDTGCFRYSNTTSKTFRTAAELADMGVDIGKINKIQFETKTKEYAAIEKMAIASMQTHFDGKCAMITVTHEMFEDSGAADCETKPLSSIPRQIEGVYAGITIKEKKKGLFNISVRTNEPVNASEIAGYLGGGGHRMAAGCTFEGTKQDAEKAVLAAVRAVFEKAGLL